MQYRAIETNNTIFALRPRCSTLLQSVEIDNEQVLNFIHSLDASKAHGCDDISISMMKICDSLLQHEKVATVFSHTDSFFRPTLFRV